MKDLKQEIINEYGKVKLTHPSYGEIGRKCHCTSEYVRQVINAHLKAKDGKAGRI